MKKNKQKKILAYLVFILLFLPSPCSPESKNNVKDWSKIDEQMFFRLKKEQGVDDAGAYEMLGREYFQEGRYDRADFYLKKSLELNPKLYLSWFYLGLVHMDNPEACLLKAIEFNANFAPSYYWLASYYCKIGKANNAVQYFKKYINVAADEPLEKERVEMAKGFINEIKNGEKGYGAITRKLITQQKREGL
jgi:tetratricopeptide (TPR) repeat protein